MKATSRPYTNMIDFLFSAQAGQVSAVDNPANWLLNYATYRRTQSGETVTPDTAMSLSTYFSCLRNLAEDMGKLPFLVYRRLERGKERAANHPLYALLHDSPNPEMGATTFIETLQHMASGWGNGYAEIERDGSGRPVNLWPIHTSRVEVKRTKPGALYYLVRIDDLSGGKGRIPFDPEDIFHLRGLGPNGVEGYSVLRAAAESLGLGLAAQRFGAAFFGNGAHAGGVLEHPAKLSPQAKDYLRASWSDMHAGAENAHKVAILEEGMKFSKISIPPEEAQFLEAREFQVEEVCRWFRMPPQKVGHLKRAQGWATVEAMNRDYVADTLLPWSRRWAQEVSRKLLTEQEKKTFFAEFLFTALLQADAKDRADFFTKMLAVGALSPNDIREAENMNPIPDGDVYLVPMNMQTVQNASKPAPTPDPSPPNGRAEEARPDPTQAVERLRPVLLDAARRVTVKESKVAEEAARKCKSRQALQAWFADYEARQAQYILEAFEPGLQVVGIDTTALRGQLWLWSMANNQAIIEAWGGKGLEVQIKEIAGAAEELAGTVASAARAELLSKGRVSKELTS